LAIFNNTSLITNPEILEQPYYAVEASCWFWKTRHLNSLADLDQIKAITVKINGGLNGFLERQLYYGLAKKYII
jgi:putative chitinase